MVSTFVIQHMIDNSHIRDPFETPNGYFESLEERIMSRLEPAKKPVSRVITLRRVVLPYLAAAAAIAGIYLFLHKGAFDLPNRAITEIGSLSDSSSYNYLSALPIEEWESEVWENPSATPNEMEAYTDEQLLYIAEKVSDLDILSVASSDVGLLF